jgi:hypothetical protein
MGSLAGADGRVIRTVGCSGGGSLTGGATRAPQPGQKRAPGGKSARHREQRETRGSPQEMQKLAPATAACPHAAQLMTGAYPSRRLRSTEEEWHRLTGPTARP